MNRKVEIIYAKILDVGPSANVILNVVPSVNVILDVGPSVNVTLYSVQCTLQYIFGPPCTAQLLGTPFTVIFSGQHDHCTMHILGTS